MQKSYEIDATKGPLFKQILIFAVPLACANVMQLLFNAIDLMIVGMFAGDNATAAVGDTTYLTGCMVNLFVGVSVGVNVVIARYYAVKDGTSAQKGVHTAIAMGFLAGIALTVLGIVICRPVLILMNTPTENHVLDMAVTYMQIYFAGMPVIMLYNFGSAILRAIGDTRRPLYFLIVAGFLNLILNLIFVCGLHLSVAGVALGTVLSQLFSCVGVLRCLTLQKGICKLYLRRVRIYKEQMIEILKIGIPTGIQSMMFSFCNMFMQSAVNTFGMYAIAGSVAVSNMEGMLYQALLSFQVTMITFASQNIAVHNIKRIRKALLISTVLSFGIGTFIGNVIYINGEMLIGLYTTSEIAISYGMIRMFSIMRFYGFAGLSETLAGCVRGMGYANLQLIASFICIFGFRIFWALIVFPIVESLQILYLLMPLSWILYIGANLLLFVILNKKYGIQSKAELSEI